MCIGCEWAPHFARWTRSPRATRQAAGAGEFGAGEFGEVSAVSRSTAPTGSAGEVPDRYADVIFRNGPVYTVSAERPWAQAVAVKGATIAYVGDESGATELTGPATTVIDLAGRLLMPGFVEGHIHPFLGSFVTAGVDLQVETATDALAAIRSYAQDNPDGPVRGFGWRVDMFGPDGPSRSDLDVILPDRPAFFFAIDGHSLWVNSKALEIAGVDRDTADPIPGFSIYVRDTAGRPTGYVLEAPAMLALVNAIAPITVESMGRLVEAWTATASAAGITTVFDAGVPPIGGDQSDLIGLYTTLESRGALPFRVVASYLVSGPPVDDAVATLARLHKQIATDLVSVRVLKILGDGTQGGYTAWLNEPYADDPHTVGESPFSEDQWHYLVTAADAAGFDVHIHACGDRAVRTGLDAIETALNANPSRDRRHTLAHLVYVEDADNRRFGELGVIAQFSANWMSADPDTLVNMAARYGPPRQDLLYRPREVLRSGGRISFGTDWPAAGYFSTCKPLDSIQIAVTRQLVGRSDTPVLAPVDQRLTVAEAVHANTLGAAYQLRLDDSVGSVDVGKRADLIVLDANIFEMDPHEIHRAEVVMTMMNGQVRHQV